MKDAIVDKNDSKPQVKKKYTVYSCGMVIDFSDQKEQEKKKQGL